MTSKNWENLAVIPLDKNSIGDPDSTTGPLKKFPEFIPTITPHEIENVSPNFSLVSYSPGEFIKNEDELIRFFMMYNRTGHGNFAVPDLPTIKSQKPYIVIANVPSIMGSDSGTEQIIGAIFGFPYAICINGKDDKALYVTYLCVHPDFRTKGLALILIKKIISIFASETSQYGYYISLTKRHQSSYRIYSWFRPINIGNCLKADYQILDSNGKHFDAGSEGQRRTRLMYQPRKLPGYDYVKVTTDTAGEGIGTKWITPGRPTGGPFIYIKEPPRGLEIYNVIKQKESKVVGTFSISLYPLMIITTGGKKIVKAYKLALFYAIDEMETVAILKTLFYVVQELKGDVIYGYDLFGLKDTYLSQVHANFTDSQDHIEFYNFTSDENIYLPVF